MIRMIKCLECKHFFEDKKNLSTKCRAFPEGIPPEIFREEFDHTKPYVGDSGIQYEKKLD